MASLLPCTGVLTPTARHEAIVTYALSQKARTSRVHVPGHRFSFCKGGFKPHSLQQGGGLGGLGTVNAGPGLVLPRSETPRDQVPPGSCTPQCCPLT